ncbi:GbsR/MarR family transcriptional regulator [Nonomuraea sp. NPDC050022]|uniref:GbsR/MarR family transcriptional regulator n=1 Tax=unclassified Nonomuraea TaxID=2593643 RepID=UPI0033D8084E
MTEIAPDEAEFVDRLGLFFEMVGGPRTMGRIYGWLMICDPPQQSLTELAAALGVSKPSISTVIRPMQEGGLVERLPSSTREHRYRLTPGGFTRVLQVQLDRMGAGAEAAEFGLSVIGEGRPEQRDRLEELRDFCEFSATEVHDEFMRRWEDYRAAKRRGR